jgi:threonylcarbamoyladenosine tRNA methylthiotransferase MtaB
MPRRFYLHTLGCKLNQTDTAALAATLRSRGMAPARRPEEADLLVVNTCTVTSRADADGRQALRRLARANPRAKLVAMGCYAGRAPEELSRIPEVDLVSGGCAAAPVAAAAEAAYPGELTGARGPHHAPPPAGGRTRATLKVQDGCDLSCSYCIVPAVRGRSRSVPPDELVESVRRLVAAGFAEIVLTGVNTGDYGRDLPGTGGLLDLLRRLTAVPGLGRLRLNSLEPRTVDQDLMAFLATCGQMAPHLQIPLQSGSDRILAAMRRNYRRRFYAELLDRLARRIPDIGLGADVIVGFPGESEQEFAETVSLVRNTPLSYLHVFSFSARPGTDAASLPGAVPAGVIKERAARLRGLAADKGAAFRRRFVGRTLQAVTLGDTGEAGAVRALTGNFFEVLLPPGSAPANRLLDVRVLAAHGAVARGVPWESGGDGPLPEREAVPADRRHRTALRMSSPAREIRGTGGPATRDPGSLEPEALS